MCVTGDQHIAIQLTLHRRQCFGVAPRHNLVAMDQADLELTDFHHFSLWERLLVEITFDEVGL